MEEFVKDAVKDVVKVEKLFNEIQSLKTKAIKKHAVSKELAEEIKETLEKEHETDFKIHNNTHFAHVNEGDEKAYTVIQIRPKK